MDCPDNPSMKGTGKDIADELRGIALFTALDPHQLQLVIDSTRVVRLDHGQRLSDHGQPARQFFRLNSGQLKLFRSSPSGGEKIIEIIQPETFSRVAARLMKDGLIRVQGQDVVLLDVEGLRARAED